MDDPSSHDFRYMRAALTLGKRGMGTTAPNPAVGCIIVRHEPTGDRIVGRGWTQSGGRPHAEAVALAQAGRNADGATAYVTLEPCSHQGVTGPCCDKLIEAGVARVVSALEDPDDRVSGGGHDKLRAAGVEIVTGVLEDDARRHHAGFLSRVVRGRPHVTLKLATSIDGKIAQPEGNRPNQITGIQARQRGHLVRARSDAILVGIGTVLTDDPVLTCRLPGLEGRSPVRVVLDMRLEIPLDSELVRTARVVPLWILTFQQSDSHKVDKLSDLGVRILETVPSLNGRADMPTALDVLGREGINNLMVEGGAKVASGLVEAGLVDTLLHFRSPDLIGPDGLCALGDVGLEQVIASGDFVLRDQFELGRDLLLTYEGARR